MQDRPNENAEHENPANWHFCFYYAPKDPRVIVPKRWGPQYGSTVNFARAGAYVLLAIPFVIGGTIVACVSLFR